MAGYFSDILVGAICARVEPAEGSTFKVYIMTIGVLAPYRRLGIGALLPRPPPPVRHNAATTAATTAAAAAAAPVGRAAACRDERARIAGGGGGGGGGGGAGSWLSRLITWPLLPSTTI